MKFFIAIIVLAGLNFGLSLAQTGTTNSDPPAITVVASPGPKAEMNRQERMNKMYPPDSIYSPWPPFNQPEPGTLPSDPRNQQIFPIPQPLPPNQTPPTQLDCLPPGAPVRPDNNPKLLPCPPPTDIPVPNGIDPDISTKAEVTK